MSKYNLLNCRINGSELQVKFISKMLLVFYKECLPRAGFPEFSKHAQNVFVCLEVFIFANNSFLRWNIVIPSIETELHMHICTILSVLQH